MNAKVIRAFTDRIGKRVYLEGDMFAGEEARVSELAGKGIVEPVDAPKPKRARKKPAAEG